MRPQLQLLQWHRCELGALAAEPVWHQLDDALTTPREREEVLKMYFVQGCIDSAEHQPEAVYRYVRPWRVRGVYSTVGRAGVGRPIISPASDRKRGRIQLSVKLFAVGVDEAKGIFCSWISDLSPGPGYRQFPEGGRYEEEYIKQLPAGKRVIRYQNGTPKVEWIKTRAWNEALVCQV